MTARPDHACIPGAWSVGELLALADYWQQRGGWPRDPDDGPPAGDPPPRAD